MPSSHRSKLRKGEGVGIAMFVVGGGLVLLGCLTGPLALVFLPMGLPLTGLGLWIGTRARRPNQP